jgi:predicted  nucleic acid-binding Zn-ribbon protein
MSPDLERLIRLQQLDLDAETRRRSLAELPAALQALDERITTRQQTLDAAKARLAENQSAKRALDKDLAVVQGRLTKFKDQLMEVKTNKEYLAMQHEISMAQDGVRTFEDKILEVMVAADELDSEIKAAEKALAEEKTKVSEERSTRQHQATRMAAEIGELTGARAKVVSELSREAIALFEHVSRARKGHAMTEARDGHCTTCHVRLRPQILNDVRRGDRLVQCESCTRILYIVPPKPAAPEAQQSTPASAR